jgi:putative FmdB family regulatory protein
VPTYDYRCEACGHTLEMFQSMSESPKRKCPECGRLKLRRVIGSGAGIIFKGSGFYQTDYRSDSYKKGAEAERKASEAKSDSGSKKADSEKADSKRADSNQGPTKDKGDAKSS